MDRGLKLAIDAAGGVRKLAAKLKLSHTAILGWKRIPAERVHTIERVCQIERSKLRPDLYPASRERDPKR